MAKKKNRSKGIGNSYERDFSKQLSLWVTHGESDDCFWRDLSSGARATSRAKQGKTTQRAGDIVATDLNYKILTDLFFIDTKCYKEFNPIIMNPKNIKSNGIFQQWLKVNEECRDNQIPFMPCKIRDNKTPEFIIMPTETNVFSQNLMSYKVVFNDKEYLFKIMLTEEFFELNDWEYFLDKNRRYTK